MDRPHIWRWQWCWWHCYVGDFMVVTVLRCWRLFSLCWWFFQCIKSVTNILNRSLTSQTCHQHISSPTSVTNINVTDLDVHLNSSIEEGNVGYVFPRVIWLQFRMRQYRDDDHQEDAPHFNLPVQSNYSVGIENTMLATIINNSKHTIR